MGKAQEGNDERIGKFLCFIGLHDWLDGFENPITKGKVATPATRTCYRHHCRLMQRLIQQKGGGIKWVNVPNKKVEYDSKLDNPGSYPELRKLLKTFKEKDRK